MDTQPITSLSSLGLSSREIEVYEELLKRGKIAASELLPALPLKRPTLYRILDELADKKLVEKDESEPIVRFRAKHPYALKEYAEDQILKIKETEQNIDALLPRLTQLYYAAQQRPGVKFYEGKEGIIKVYEEILSENKPIDSIEEKGDMISYIPDYVPVYVKKRIQKKLPNRVISPDTNKYNVTNQERLITAKLLPAAQFPFRMDIKIAGNKVSLITFNKDSASGILIDNQEIAENFQMLFNLLWQRL